MNFEAIHKGYFLGGDMWRGRLTVGPGISPGEYSLAVLPKRTVSSRKAPAFRILVFADPASLQQSSTSLVRRWFGYLSLRRWRPAACRGSCWPSAPSIGCPGGGRRCWPQAARPEVYRVTRGDDGYEIRFGLGTAHGISPGARVAIYDEAGQQVGTGTVEVSNQRISVAQVTSDQPIKAGYLVSRV